MYKRPLFLMLIAFILTLVFWVIDFHEFNGDYVRALFEVLLMSGILFIFLWLIVVIYNKVRSVSSQ